MWNSSTHLVEVDEASRHLERFFKYNTYYKMKLEDQQPCELDVRQILEDPARRETVVRSLQEALSAFGYKNTLECLQAESKVAFQKDRTPAIESFLKAYDYEAARTQIQLLEIPEAERTELINSVDELHVLRLVSEGSEGENDRAITFLSSRSIPEEQRKKYYAIIALKTVTIDNKQVEKQHLAILQRCKKQPLRQKNIKDMFSTYLLSNSITAPRPKNEAPKTVIAESERGLSIVGIPHFIKFNQSADRLIVVSEGRQEYEVSLWTIDRERVRKICSFRERANGSIVSVEWSSKEVAGQLVGVCSYDELVVFTASDLSLSYRISRTILDLPKFLTFCWHPVSEVVYLGGLFPKLIGLDSSGEVITEVCPFMTTRKIVFSPRGELFAIMATTRGRLVKFNVETESVESQLVRESLFMDLKWHQQKVLLTNNELIFILNATTLEPIYTCESPPNQKLLTIEAFLCGEWLIAFNEKVRGTLRDGNMVTQLKWDNCDAIDVRGKIMASIGPTIKIWSTDSNAQPLSYESIGWDHEDSASDSESQSSPSEEDDPSEDEEQRQQIEVYRELMEIEFMGIEDLNGQE